jgi:hypothetical protein
MKKQVAVLVLGLVFTSLAQVVKMPNNCLLNFWTNKTTTTYTTDAICSNFPNLGYDFFWTYYEGCTCMCDCCPMITIGSPHPFYISKKAMDLNEIQNIAMLQDTTFFSKCSTSTFRFNCGSKMASIEFNCTDSKARDTLCTRLFIFQISNYFFMGPYMPLKIRSIHAFSVSCPYQGTSQHIDSLTVAYGIATPVEPRVSVSSRLAYIHSIRNGRLTTVSGRSVSGTTLCPGTFVDGNKKTVRITGWKNEKAEP